MQFWFLVVQFAPVFHTNRSLRGKLSGASRALIGTAGLLRYIRKGMQVWVARLEIRQLLSRPRRRFALGTDHGVLHRDPV